MRLTSSSVVVSAGSGALSGALSGAFSGWAAAGLAEAGRVIVRPFGWEEVPRRPGQRAAAARRISRNRWA